MVAGNWRVRSARALAVSAGVAALITLAAAPSASALSLGGRPPSGSSGQPGAANLPTHYTPVPYEQGRASRYQNAGVLNYGAAAFYGSPTNLNLPSVVVGMATTQDGKGYWLVTANGAVFSYGDAQYHGGAQGLGITGPIVGMAATPDGGGYWLVSQNGGVLSYGDAKFYGSAGGLKLGSPIVGMAADPQGGYWLAAEGGGVFSFGAPYFGSMAGRLAGSPLSAIAATPSGKGYMLVSGDGAVFTFGDAPFKGALFGQNFPAWITSVAIDATDGGYWLAGADGSVYPFGDAPSSYGDDASAAHSPPIAQIVPTPTSNGYWLLEPDAFPTVFSNPASDSSLVSLASTQVTADPDSGYFCNPYGACEPWCALFATWVWQTSGIDIPQYAFVGDIYDWAEANTEVLAPTARPKPGDIILYGTGPQNVDTAVHTGIVAQVWPDGAIDTIEGDAGPAATGQLSVVINGPFLPSDSENYNGFPVFGYALP